MSKQLKRFVWRESQNGLFKETRIIVDTQTGVNYLFVCEGYGGGLTPLLDENGKPIITKNIVE
ncbi:MAG: xylan 1,4-beta-xylosidase [Muribaculaceae bacterium]|nr:xylan 1,4-beta-xylosidase [Muribaculaceae bacterium]